MLTSKIVIIGAIVRREGNKVYVQCGEATHMYNTDYYRVVPEV